MGFGLRGLATSASLSVEIGSTRSRTCGSGQGSDHSTRHTLGLQLSSPAAVSKLV